MGSPVFKSWLSSWASTRRPDLDAELPSQKDRRFGTPAAEIEHLHPGSKGEHPAEPLGKPERVGPEGPSYEPIPVVSRTSREGGIMKLSRRTFDLIVLIHDAVILGPSHAQGK